MSEPQMPDMDAPLDLAEARKAAKRYDLATDAETVADNFYAAYAHIAHICARHLGPALAEIDRLTREPDSSDPAGRPHPVPVFVADALAGELIRLAVLGARLERDRSGAVPSRHLAALLGDLHAADQRHQAGLPQPTFRNESVRRGPATMDTSEVTAETAASAMGCSTQWVRALVRSGVIAGRRAGRHLWLIDRRSLDLYRHRGKAS